jgi:hypothetical protein
MARIAGQIGARAHHHASKVRTASIWYTLTIIIGSREINPLAVRSEISAAEPSTPLIDQRIPSGFTPTDNATGNEQQSPHKHNKNSFHGVYLLVNLVFIFAFELLKELI